MASRVSPCFYRKMTQSKNKQYTDFVPHLNSPENKRFKILNVEKTADDELKISLGISESWFVQTSVYFKGVIDFRFYTSGGEDWFSLPQFLNAFTYRHNSQTGESFNWELLGETTEWSFIAPFPARIEQNNSRT